MWWLAGDPTALNDEEGLGLWPRVAPVGGGSRWPVWLASRSGLRLRGHQHRHLRSRRPWRSAWPWTRPWSCRRGKCRARSTTISIGAGRAPHLRRAARTPQRPGRRRRGPIDAVGRASWRPCPTAPPLVVGHGGGIEPGLVACLPDADHQSWVRRSATVTAPASASTRAGSSASNSSGRRRSSCPRAPSG
jgi:hypothetical protein